MAEHSDACPQHEIRRCTPDFPCPVCKSTSWCQAIGDHLVQCMRESNGSYKTIQQEDGASGFMHRIGVPETTLDAAGLRPPKQRAHADLIHQVYQALLDSLKLPASSPNREALRSRGLSDEWIDRAGYRDYAGKIRRWDLAKSLYGRFGSALLGVPGVVVKEGRNGHYLTLAGAEGLLVPVRDRHGQISALKIRRSDAEPNQAKYSYITSSRKDWDGPKAVDGVHVPLGTDLSGPILRITEGPLKADICVAIGNVPTVAAPSAGSWKRVVVLLKELPNVYEVRVALDGDFRTNLQVTQAVRGSLAAITAMGKVARLEVWDETRAKGIDDALAPHSAPLLLGLH